MVGEWGWRSSAAVDAVAAVALGTLFRTTEQAPEGGRLGRQQPSAADAEGLSAEAVALNKPRPCLLPRPFSRADLA